jgi:hypothetical protein
VIVSLSHFVRVAEFGLRATGRLLVSFVSVNSSMAKSGLSAIDHEESIDKDPSMSWTSGPNPSIETVAIGTLCSERGCKWQRSDLWAGIRMHFGRWPLSG